MKLIILDMKKLKVIDIYFFIKGQTKFKNRFTKWSNDFTCEYLFKKIEIKVSKRCLHSQVYCK